MKIAAVSEDGATISQHFGRAPFYVVVTVESGTIVSLEQRDKTGCGHGHGHGHGHHEHEHGHGHHEHEHEHGHHEHEHGHGHHEHAHSRHATMASVIADCEAVLSRGMGNGAYQGMQQLGIRPVITDIASIDEAVMAYAEGRIVDHTERLH